MGSIQVRGLFFAVAPPDGRIDVVGANACTALGAKPSAVLGRPFAEFLDPAGAAHFAAALSSADEAANNPHDVTLLGTGGSIRCEVVLLRRDDGGLVVECEPQTSVERPRYTDIQGAIERLQATPDAATLLAVACADLRALTGCRRLHAARFDADGGATVVADATCDADALLGVRLRAADLPAPVRPSAMRSPLLTVADVGAPPVRLFARDAGAAAAIAQRSALRRVPTRLVAILTGLRARGAFVISLAAGGKPWGAVVGLHDAPLPMRYAQRAQCELLAHMVTWQLGLRLAAQARHAEAVGSARFAALSTALGAHADVAAAVVAAAGDIAELLDADAVAVRVGETVAAHGALPVEDAAMRTLARALMPGGGDPVASTNDAGTLPEPLRAAGFSGALAIRLSENGDVVLALRAGRLGAERWIGPPGPDGRSRLPAEPWSAPSATRSRPWSAADVRHAHQIAARIGERIARRRASDRPRSTADDAELDERSARLDALTRLQEDIAAALPARDDVIAVVLQFIRNATCAGGSALERLDGDTLVVEVADGLLAPHAGRRYAADGALASLALARQQPVCFDDVEHDAQADERAWCGRMGIGSMLAVPLPLGSDRSAVLKVVSARRWAFRQRDAQTLELSATTLLGALRAAGKFAALAAAEREQRTYARQLRALHAIASTTTSHGNDQIGAALALGLKQLDLDWAFLGLIDYGTQELVIQTSVANDGAPIIAPGVRLALGSTALGRVALSKRVVVIEDVGQLAAGSAADGWRSAIAVPLFIGGENYGAIGFTARTVRREPFSDANIEFLAVAGELISSAIERGLQREAIESSQSQRRALIDAIPQMMWVSRGDEPFAYVNERWTQYTGLSLDATRARAYDTVFHTDDVPWPSFDGRLAPTESDTEIRLRRADGVYRWHLVRSVEFGSGDDAQRLVTATDIEARKAAETLLADVHNAALAATEAKSRFLATMSHEIRTPMNGVIGMTELLLLTPLNDEQREYTEIIRDSGQSLLRVLNDILDYSKIEAGKLELETVRFDLPGQIESVVELLRPGFMAKEVTFETHLAPDVRTTVFGDPGRLRQILLNLAGNALKFTDGGGAVHIRVTTSAAVDDVAQVRFAIEDTGIGIPATVVGRLFQPFAQGDESTTRKYGGTGLGLSISAQLVTLMGGEIGVESAVGVGSTFWFAVPFKLAANSLKIADVQRRQPQRSEPAPMRSEKILLVEDNEINTFLALKQLQRLGFAITAVTNGLQAVETVTRERYDLVLMDCHMPEMDGFAATREIRRLGGDRPHLPIVAMTADARDEDHQNCLSAGMDDYLSKPTNLESLRAVLDRWLPAPERRRTMRTPTLHGTLPAVGMTMLLELFNGDRGAVLDLLTAAQSSIAGDIARVERASAMRDFDLVIEAAHRLKGTSGSIRFNRLVEIGAAIEAEARVLPPPAAISEPLLAEARAAIAALSAEVVQLRKNVDTVRSV